MDTKIYKGHSGWKAETTVDLGADSRVLRVSTYKSAAGGLFTYATVHKAEGRGLVHMPFSDFVRRVSVAGARCTEKNVRELHQDALARIDSIRGDAIAHYAAKGEGVAHG